MNRRTLEFDCTDELYEICYFYLGLPALHDGSLSQARTISVVNRFDYLEVLVYHSLKHKTLLAGKINKKTDGKTTSPLQKILCVTSPKLSVRSPTTQNYGGFGRGFREGLAFL